MILNFVDTLKCLHSKYPDGCLCLEYKDTCKHYPHYPFCKLNIEGTVKHMDKNCKKSSKDIDSDICFILTKYNLDAISSFLSNFEIESFYGSIAYYSHNDRLLFCAISFIDDVMAPEVMTDNIDCLQELEDKE